MYCHHTNKRTRELAHIILINIGDSEFFNQFSDIPSFIKQLDIEEHINVIIKFQDQNVTLHHLLNPLISLDQVLKLLKTFNFKIGTTFTILDAIAKVRLEEETAHKQCLAVANEVNIMERELAINHTVISSPQLKTGEKKNIFVSYCWANKITVKKLHGALSEKNLSCWLDERQMQGGSQLFGEIDKGISECQIFLACCSNNYGASTNCQRELLLASDRQKLVIPVLVGACNPWPPEGQMGPLLAGKIYIDLSSDEKFEKTIEQLVTVVSQSLY